MNIGTKIGAMIAHFAESTAIKMLINAVNTMKQIISGSPVNPTDFRKSVGFTGYEDNGSQIRIVKAGCKLSREEDQNHEAGQTTDGLVHKCDHVLIVLDGAGTDTIRKTRKQE